MFKSSLVISASMCLAFSALLLGCPQPSDTSQALNSTQQGAARSIAPPEDSAAPEPETLTEDDVESFEPAPVVNPVPDPTPEPAVGTVTPAGPELVSVPDVVGLFHSDARTVLHGVGLQLGAVSMVYADAVGVDVVVDQDPVAAAEVAPGSAISLFISKGPERLLVPDVTGMVHAAAETALAAAIFTIGEVTEAYDNLVPEGHVISQTPAGGAYELPGTPVSLVVSLGLDLVQVPNVVGLLQTDAEAVIDAAGLQFGAVSLMYNDAVPLDVVINQDPPAVVMIGRGSAINVVVSMGIKPVVVPSLRGYTQEAAETAIFAAGLVRGSIVNMYHPSVARGRVISHIPVAATVVPPGSAVSLAVSLGREPVTVPDTVGQQLIDSIGTLEKAGLVVGSMSPVVNDIARPNTVLTQTPTAGASAYRGDAVNLMYASPQTGSRDAAVNWTFESDHAEARLGAEVACAGDVNGDGYDDLLVGAHMAGYEMLYQGRVYLFLGTREGLFATPVWSRDGGLPYEQLGYSLSTAGDVNGDGYDDVIIGTQDIGTLDEADMDSGAAHLYLGGPAGLSPDPDWTIFGSLKWQRLGWEVAGGGDVNGDGYDDVLVSDELGAVRLYYGSADGLDTRPAWVSTSVRGYGRNVAVVGDLNGDGCAEVAIAGASGEDALFVFYGSPTGPRDDASWIFSGTDATRSIYKITPAGAGDVNGDGFGDLIISAACADRAAPALSENEVVLYFGSASGLAAKPDWTLTRPAVSRDYPVCVAGIDDTNGDGFDDIILGDPHDSRLTLQHAGCAEVYHGSGAGLGSVAQRIVLGSQAHFYLGCAVTGGDFNGDGYTDLAVGVTGFTGSELREGSVNAFHGHPDIVK